MSWRDNLLDASFRGAAFKISTSDHGVGRRNEMHQYINRDKPYLEDLGSDADEFSVEGYVIQNKGNDFDYFAERDALISALKSKGAGILIHPFYGIKRVGLKDKAKIVEDFTSGGIAKFSMTFVEAGERVIPEFIEDFINKVDNAVNKIYDKAGDFFCKVFTIVPEFESSITNAITKSLSTIQTAIAGAQALPTITITEVKKNISNILATVNDMKNSPVDVYNAIKNSCNNLCSICGMGEIIAKEQSSTTGTPSENDVVTESRITDTYAKSTEISTVVGGETGEYSGITRGEIKTLDGTNIPDFLGKSILRIIVETLNNFSADGYNTIPYVQQNNIVMIFDIMKLCLLSNACRIATRTEFFSQEDIIEFRELVMQAFEDFLILLGDEAAEGSSSVDIGDGTEPIWNQDIFLSVEELKDLFCESMIDKITNTPKAINYVGKVDGDNCLILAYDKYEDLERFLEIYKRNKNIIRHPGFIPGGQTIRILAE